MSLEIGQCRDRINSLSLSLQKSYRFAKSEEHLNKMQSTVEKLRQHLSSLDDDPKPKDLKKIYDFCDTVEMPENSKAADWMDFLDAQQRSLNRLIMDGLADAIYRGEISHPNASKIRRVMDAKLQKTPAQGIAEIKKILEA